MIEQILARLRYWGLLAPKKPRFLTAEQLRDPVRVAYRKALVRGHHCTKPICRICIEAAGIWSVAEVRAMDQDRLARTNGGRRYI